ncbi:MAG: serine hydrolase [Nanoarchaeota archaeon]
MSLVQKLIVSGTVAVLGLTGIVCGGNDNLPQTSSPIAYVTSIPTVSPSPTPSPSPVPTLSPTPLAPEFLALESQLTQKVRDYETNYGMNISVAVTDFQSSQSISVDGNEPHEPGCVINQFPVYLVVSDAQAGKLNLGDMDGYIKNSVNRSNPDSTAAFLSYYYGSESDGVLAVQKWMDDHSINGVYEHVPTHPPRTNNMLTALSTNKVLTMLAIGELFNPELTGYVINDVMTYSNFLYAIPSGVDADERVAHKIGYFWKPEGWVHNDSGIVYFPGQDGNEKAFMISIFTSGGAGKIYPFATIAQDLTRTANDYFRGAY